MSTPAAHDEKLRLAALQRYAVLDTPPEPALDDLVQVAAALCGTPTAVLALLDQTRSWHKARVGLDAAEAPRELSFCTQLLEGQHCVLVVEDAANDARLAQHPAVLGGSPLRFYAGVALRTPDGHLLGTLCVGDTQPRTLSPAALAALQALGRQAMAYLELRRERLAQRAQAQAREAEQAGEVAHLALLDAALRALAQPTLCADGLLLEAVEGARELTRAATARVSLWAPGEARLVRSAGDDPGFRMPLAGSCLDGPLLVADCGADPRVEGARAAARGVRSLVAVPLVLDGARRGVLEVSSPTPHAFGARDLHTLQLLAHGTGVALARLRAVSGLATALQEQQRSEELFRSAFEHSPIGFALIDPDGRLLRVNQAMSELLGIPVQELLGTTPPLFATTGEHVGRPMLQQLRSGERTFVQFTLRYETRNGGSVPARVSLSAVRDAGGAIVRYLAQVEDTTAASAAMEAAMQRAELLDAAHDAIMGTDPDGRVSYWNRAAEELYGWSAEEARGQLSQELLRTQFPASTDALRTEFHLAGRWEGELVQTARDGREVIVSSRWSLQRDPAGKPHGVLAVNRDVTARRRAQDALARSEESLAATLRSLTEGVIVTDPEERVTRMNPAAEALTGFSSTEALGLPLSQVFPLVDEHGGEPRESPLRHALRARAPVQLADRSCLQDRSGRRVPVAASGAPLRATGGEVAGGGVLVFRDVTEERRTHDALHRKKREFRQLIDALPDAVLILREQRVHYANAAAARMLGRAGPAQLVGTGVLELVPAAEREKLQQLVGVVPGSGEPMGELRFVRAEGEEAEELVVEVASMNLPGFEGGPAVLLVGRDLTERRKLQQRLLLADRMASVGTLAAGVAHEINNPLAFVIGNLTFLAEELRELGTLLTAPALQQRLQEARTALGEASQGAERVRLIVKDLHTFSRADEALKERLDVRRALDSSIAMTANVVRHRARLVREYAEVPGVRANEARLGQVFVNLLVNAAHAIPEEASQEAVQPHEICVRTRSAGPWVVVEVQDTGAGISAQHRSRIFDPFFTTKPVGQGTGLGLSICHSIVTALGGKIELESEPGRGTTFRVLLPACEDEAGEAPAPAAPSTRPLPGGRVLVLDDEPQVGTLLRRLFGSELEVVTETSAREALSRLAAGERYDAMLCDVMMPEMGGADVQAEVARLAPALARRMLFVTGGAFSPRAQAFLAALPPDGFLTKPFELRELRERLRTLVERPEGC